MTTDSLRDQVLAVLQAGGPATATRVWEVLRATRPISRTALHTVLTRLVAAGLVVRHGPRRHYIYECRSSADVAQATARRAARDLMLVITGNGLVHFVDALEQGSPEVAQQLQRLLAERHSQDHPS